MEGFPKEGDGGEVGGEAEQEWGQWRRQWREWVAPIARRAAEDPWNFISSVMLILSPLILISMFLSYKLLRNLENQKKDKKKKVKRDAKGKRKKNKDG